MYFTSFLDQILVKTLIQYSSIVKNKNLINLKQVVNFKFCLLNMKIREDVLQFIALNKHSLDS